MSVQILVGRWTAGSAGNIVPLVSGTFNNSSQTIATPMVVAGTFANWTITLTAAPGVGNSRTFTLYKNGSATAVTLTISGASTSNSDTTHSVHYAAGDTIEWRYSNSGSPAAAEFESSIEWTPDSANVTITGWSSGTLDANGECAAFYGAGLGTAGFTRASIVICPGTVTDLRWRVRTAPGAGQSRTALFVLNGVDQDGTGGTVDTRATISDANTSAASSFSLAIVAGDLLSIKQTRSAAPAGTTWACGMMAMTPTVAGQYQFSVTAVGLGTAQKYNWPVGQGVGESATESERTMIGSVTTFTISAMRAECPVAPGAGKSWTYTLRVNGADTGLAVTISGAVDTKGSATITPPISIASGDTWDIGITSTGTPGSTTTDRRISLLRGTLGGAQRFRYLNSW